MRRAQAGDAAALGEPFERYQDRLHRIARIRMGARLREVMESMDLVQRVNAVALAKLGEFEHREHARIVHWLVKILENPMRQARREAGALELDPKLHVPIEESPPSEAERSPRGVAPPDRAPSPSQIVRGREARGLYDECVEALEPDHRDMILLRDDEGASWEFIREEMGRPTVAAVRELHRRAKARLAALFARRMGESAP